MSRTYGGTGQGYIKIVNSDSNAQVITDCSVNVTNIMDDEEESFYYDIFAKIPGILDCGFIAHSIDSKDSSFPLNASVNGFNFVMTSLDEEGGSYSLTVTGNLSPDRQFYYAAILEELVEDKNIKPKTNLKKNLKLKEKKNADDKLKKEIAEFLKSKKL